MQGAKSRAERLRGKAALGLLALALLLRLLVPAGWMPATGSGYQITLCTGMGAVSAWVGKDGQIHKGKPADSKTEQPCAFSGFSAALNLPMLDGLAIAPSIAASVVLITKLTAVTIGRGLAAPPPPQTGPPATL